ncbi:MAG: FliA/WhiG family RNA polymerase sigma factor [Lachnospirales bacterium]
MSNVDELWLKYKKNKSKEIRDELIVNYLPLVKILAGRVSMQVGQYVEYDDLVSYGIFGLIDAIDKYDYQQGNKFETYASLRIRGSIIDAIRKMDWIPRSVRQKRKDLESAYNYLLQTLGREPTDLEVSKELNLTVEQYEELIKKSNISSLVSLDEQVGEENNETFGNIYITSNIGNPEEEISKEELKKMLVDALGTLNEKEKIVISLYYFDELALKEIASVLGVTDARISQIHSKALFKLKNKLGKHQEILFNV